MQAERMEPGDIDEVVARVREYHAQSNLRQFPYYNGKVAAVLTAGLQDPKQLYIVVREAGKPIGGLAGSILEFPFSRDVYAQDHMFYVTQEHRSLFVAQALIVAYLDWALEQGAKHVRLETISGYQPIKFGNFVRRHGFKLLGTIYARDF